MLKCILAALLLLHPTPRVDMLAKVIHKATSRWHVHPAFVLAVIHHETGGTWRVKAKSRTNDYGLMQLHVSHQTNSEYQGKEHLLYNPTRNIKLGVRMLHFWRRHHIKHCKRPRHHWISHYNQGGRVRSLRYERRVLKIHTRLMTRYWNQAEPKPGPTKPQPLVASLVQAWTFIVNL